MGVIGGSAGYATVDPIQGNPVGDALSYVDILGFKRREEKNFLGQQRKEEERRLREDRNDELKDALAFDEKYKVSESGIQSVDTKIHDVALKLKQVYAQANQEYKNAKTNDQKNAAYQKMSNSMAGLGTLKQFPDAYNSATEAMVKGLSEGIYSESSSKRKASEIDKFANGQYVTNVDDRGNIRFSTFDMDENGKVSKVKSKDLTAQEMLMNFQPTKAFNIDGTGSGTKKGDSLIKIYKDSIGKERKVIEGFGLNAKEKTYNPGAEELARSMALEAVQDKDKLYELFDRIGIDPENPKNYTDQNAIKNAAEYLENKLIASAPTTISNKPDTSIERLNVSKANSEETRRNNSFNRSQKSNEAKTVEVTDKETPFGPETTVKRKMSDEKYAEEEKNKPKETPKDKTEKLNLWDNPLTRGISNAFKVKSKTKTTSKAKSSSEPRKTINRSEIAAKAKAGGYSVKEYEALLVKNGITIKS